MPKSNRGGRRINNPPQNIGPRNYTVMTDQEAQQVRDDVEDMYDPSTRAAIKMYISKADHDDNGYSMAQTLNYKLDNGGSLDASEDYADRYMHAAMHDLGKDTLLVRGAHDDMLKLKFGITNYQTMSDQQLQQALVGATYTTDSYVSTSYDITKNPFLSAQSGSGVSGGREVVYNIKAKSDTKVVFGAKAQSEIVIDKGTQFKITGVRRSGSTVAPRNSGLKQQIIIDMEVV